MRLEPNDRKALKECIERTFDVGTITSVTELFNTNRCESLHSTIFQYAPKFSCWTRNFAALCHSATHSRTLGKGVATVKLAHSIGIRVSSKSVMVRGLNKLDRRMRYHSARKAEPRVRQSRYLSKRREGSRALLRDSLYGQSSSAVSNEHSYGVNV